MRPFDQAWTLLKQQQCHSVARHPHLGKSYQCILPDGHTGSHRHEQEVESPDIPEAQLNENPFANPPPQSPPAGDDVDFDFNDY